MSACRLNLVSAIAAVTILNLVACGASSNSANDLKVTNGAKAGAAFPAVVSLNLQAGQTSGMCTGTFVNDSQVVSAAHCIFAVLEGGGDASSMKFVNERSDGSVTETSALKFAYHPDYVNDPTVLNKNDIAVLTFPRGSAPAAVRLYGRRPKVGQNFTIVGFGLNDYDRDTQGNQVGSGGGVKRMGTNKIQSISNGMIEFTGVPTAADGVIPQGQNVASGSGDSGGPLLIDGALAATTSGGGLTSVWAGGKYKTLKASSYVDLNLPSNRSFLAQQLTLAPGW